MQQKTLGSSRTLSHAKDGKSQPTHFSTEGHIGSYKWEFWGEGWLQMWHNQGLKQCPKVLISCHFSPWLLGWFCFQIGSHFLWSWKMAIAVPAISVSLKSHCFLMALVGFQAHPRTYLWSGGLDALIALDLGQVPMPGVGGRLRPTQTTWTKMCGGAGSPGWDGGTAIQRRWMEVRPQKQQMSLKSGVLGQRIWIPFAPEKQ